MMQSKSLFQASCMLRKSNRTLALRNSFRHYSRSSASSTGFVSVVQGAIAKMKLISNGIKLFTAEYKEVSALRKEKGNETPGKSGTTYNEQWLRNEIVKAKRVSAAKVRVALTAVIFTIPGGGFVVVGVLLGWPQYLTSHFWDDSMKDEFKRIDYSHKLRLQTAAKLGRQGLEPHLNILKMPRLAEKERSTLRGIAAYHGVINAHLNKSAPFIFENMLVSPLIQLHLVEKFEEIIADDALILREAPNRALTRDELQEACLERMVCSPNISDENMRFHLGEWMQKDTTQKMDAFMLNLNELPAS